MMFMPHDLACRLSFEGRSWNSKEWQGVPNEWSGSFGFHSFLSAGVPTKPLVANHAGDAGDVVYSLPVLKHLGGGALFLTPNNKFPFPRPTRWAREGGDASFVDNLAPLLEAQPYIWCCKYTQGTPFSTDVDLNAFRRPWSRRTSKDFHSILSLHCEAFGVPMPTEPWLTVPNPIVVPGRPIVVARSPRFQNNEGFPWDRIVAKYHDKMVFVGLDIEAKAFQGFSLQHEIPHYQTKDALELARVVAGAKLCVMNQSLPLAIANGLFKEVVVEEWPGNSNTRMDRPGFHAGWPKNWEL